MFSRFLSIACALLATGVSAQEKPKFEIVDTHTHFYDPTRPQGVPWPGKNDKLLYRPVLPAEFKKLARPFGVVGTIVVEAKGERLAHLGIEYTVRGEPELRINSQGETNSVPSAEWREFQARLRIDPKKKPDQIKAKVFINGVANAWIKDAELVHVAHTEPKPAAAPFAVLAKDARAERMYATLAGAVAAAQAGDTIEIRGNGAFVGDTIHITKALTIRAASGYEPTVQLSADVTEKEGALFYAKAPLVLEGCTCTFAARRPGKTGSPET